MNKKNTIKIPNEIKNLFNQEYLDLELAIKIIKSDNQEIKNFFTQIIPLVKDFLSKQLPLIKMLNIL